VQAAIQQYLKQLEFEQSASEHTLQAYKTDLRQFIVFVTTQAGKELSPIDLSEELIRSYTDWLRAQGYRPATISRKFAALRSFLQFLIEAGLITTTGIDDGLKVEYQPRKKPRMLDRDELSRLLEAPRSGSSPGSLRDAAILALLYEGGFRATELVKLRLADVQLSQARIRHPSQPEQSVNVPDAVERIRAYLQEGRPHLARDPFESALFLNQRGKGLTRQGLWLVVKRWATAAGIDEPLSPHTLRHTRARDLLERGVNRRAVQRFLGLSSPNAIRIHAKKPKNQE
jgi:site-specific recombinase XerD